MKVKSVLVSQPINKAESTPYLELQEKHKLKIDFRSFIHVEGLSAKEVRNQKVDLSKYTAVILTSRNAVDHFFRIAEEMRFKIPDTFKYFCQTEAVAFYLQKYVVYRKRKVYVGERTFQDVMVHIKKYKEEKFLLPSSDTLKEEVPGLLNSIQIDWKHAVFYKTMMSDLSDLRDVYYDVLVFFTPTGIRSLFKNFPDFKQNDTRIAVFGTSALKAAEEAGLRIDIKAPSQESPSMTAALDKYIAEANKGK
jgi:uroporphyrinogen-III synthase